MNKIHAPIIVTNEDSPIINGTIVVDQEGVILEISTDDSVAFGARPYQGAIIPGMINAHCHLELSHLKGVIPTGTGLIPFIKDVVTKRDFATELIQEAIVAADRDMWTNGIQAVGDISNTLDTSEVKRQSPIAYYSFIELFDFLDDGEALSCYLKGLGIFERMNADGSNRKSLVPHAPYSVSPSLLKHISSHNKAGETVSVHNQELAEEDRLFIDKNGGFIDFYKGFGLSLENFVPTGQSSIHYTMSNLSATFKTLFVHNTCTTQSDIEAAIKWNPESYWVTCPNANLYIENRLPPYRQFLNLNATVCIGTDSLSSNWQLSILEEMKTIKKYNSYIDDLKIIEWATTNGAEALNYPELGKLAIGTRPGIIGLENAFFNGKIDILKTLSVDRFF